jgi:hypothetical protein
MDLAFRQTPATGMQDVAALANVAAAPVTVAGSNGSVWRSTDSGATFIQVPASGFRRLAASPDGSVLWGVGANGTLWWSKSPGRWTRLEGTTGLDRPVEDAVVDYDNWLWITTTNGQILSLHDGVHFELHPVFTQMKRLAVGPGHRFWAIDFKGNLYTRDNKPPVDQWSDTKGSGMEDVTVSNRGDVWLVGTNGTVWTTRDGESFTQTSGAGFVSASAAGGDTVWLVGKNGTLWTLARPAEVKPPPPPVGPPVPPPPPSTSTTVRLSVVNQATQFFAIDSVAWSIWRQDPGMTTLVMSAAGPDTTIALPSGRQYYIRADVVALSAVSGESEFAEFRGGTQISGVSVQTIVLNSPQTKSYRLIAEPAGGHFGGVNPVVVV